MRTYTQSKGWYSDITLEGDWCSLIRDSHILVNGNIVNLPENENILFLTCKKWNSQVFLAGQGHKSGKCWLYRDGSWQVIGTTFAVNPCAFGPNELYFVSGQNQYKIYDFQTKIVSNTIPKALGSQGIRYIDYEQSADGIITGDSTYGPTPYNLSQWVLRGNLVLGQSYEDGGLGLILGENYHKFISGSCEFIRYYRSGNNLAFVSVNQPENYASFFWMTLNEFELFPSVPYGMSKEPGPINNKFPGIPEYKPLIPLKDNMAPNQLVTVQRMMRLHPEINTLDESERGRIIDYVCNALGGKPWGRKARNKDGSNKNTDALCYILPDGRFEIYDVISGGDGSATWDYSGTFANGENGYWAEAEPVSGGVVNPPPVVTNKSKDQLRMECNEIIRFYNESDGLNRLARGQKSPIEIHDQAVFDWFVLLMTRSIEDIKNEIRTFPEYKQQHGG